MLVPDSDGPGKGRERLHKKPKRGRSPPEPMEVAKTQNRQLYFLGLTLHVHKYPQDAAATAATRRVIVIMNKFFNFFKYLGK